MDAGPAFSVIVPTLDRPALLTRALRSALAQRDASFEIIVADDGRGAGADAARAMGLDAFVTGHLGQVPARNAAIARARGRWLAPLDDDDWWDDEWHLARLAATLRQSADLAFASGRIIYENSAPRDALPFAARADAEALRHDNMLLNSGIAYARAWHARLGPLDTAFPHYWDWDWYLRLAAQGARFLDAGGDGVRISVRAGTVSSVENEAARRDELQALGRKHGLPGLVLKNHESIARDQHASHSSR